MERLGAANRITPDAEVEGVVEFPDADEDLGSEVDHGTGILYNPAYIPPPDDDDYDDGDDGGEDCD